MVLFEAKARAREEFASVAAYLGLDEKALADLSAGAPKMPAAMTQLPGREISTAANYLWWLQRPAALRSLPVPTEILTDIIVRYRR
jgi:hypothetical protein